MEKMTHKNGRVAFLTRFSSPSSCDTEWERPDFSRTEEVGTHLAAAACGCVRGCVFPRHNRTRGKDYLEKEKRDDTRVQGDAFISMIKMKIAGKGIPTPCKAGMMTPECRAHVISLCAFLKMKYACRVSHWPQKILESLTKKSAVWFEGERRNGFQALPIFRKWSRPPNGSIWGLLTYPSRQCGAFSSPPLLEDVRG